MVLVQLISLPTCHYITYSTNEKRYVAVSWARLIDLKTTFIFKYTMKHNYNIIMVRVCTWVGVYATMSWHRYNMASVKKYWCRHKLSAMRFHGQMETIYIILSVDLSDVSRKASHTWKRDIYEAKLTSENRDYIIANSDAPCPHPMLKYNITLPMLVAWRNPSAVLACVLILTWLIIILSWSVL